MIDLQLFHNKVNFLDSPSYLKEPTMQDSALDIICRLTPGTVIRLLNLNALEYNEEPTKQTPKVCALRGNYVIWKHIMEDYRVTGCILRGFDDGNLYELRQGITK